MQFRSTKHPAFLPFEAHPSRYIMTEMIPPKIITAHPCGLLDLLLPYLFT